MLPSLGILSRNAILCRNRKNSEKRDETVSNPLPLQGIRVLDIGTLIAGPFGATMLGDFGAEVIKVEQPGRGDALRGRSGSIDFPLLDDLSPLSTASATGRSL